MAKTPGNRQKKTTVQKNIANNLVGTGTPGLEHLKELNIHKFGFAFHNKYSNCFTEHWKLAVCVS